MSRTYIVITVIVDKQEHDQFSITFVSAGTGEDIWEIGLKKIQKLIKSLQNQAQTQQVDVTFPDQRPI
jgi:hypothetical protein